MTDIEMCTSDGTPIGTYTAQLCLQHGYGDGKRLSCRRTQEAVSNLFDNLPIDGYVSLQMDAIPIINDAMGGIEVTCLQDLSYPSVGIELTEGETVTLNGTEAYYYLRGRDTNEFDSASLRLRREEQYITAFMNELHSRSDKTSLLNDIYNKISDYMVTNVHFVDLLEDFADFTLTEDHVYTVPGETIQGDEFEEYYVDDEALYDLIIEVFYNEVDENGDVIRPVTTLE
jgi:LCP family protein required for cell wall assembly